VRKLLVAAAVIGLVAGVIVFVHEREANQAQRPNIRVVRIDRGDLILTVSATGTVAPAQTAKLSFETPGIVQEVLVDEGQRVKAGQLLARQDDAAQKLAVEQAEANLNVAQLTLQQVMAPPGEKDIAIAEANVKAAQGAYNALLGMVDPNAIRVAELRYRQAKTAWDDAITHRKDIGGRVSTDSPTYQLALAQEGQASFLAEIARLQLELLRRGADSRLLVAAKARIAEAQAELERLKAGPPRLQVDRAQLAIDQARIARDEAQRLLDSTQLHAPFSGIVTAVNVKIGALSLNDLPAVVVTDNAQLHVDIKVDEIDIGLLRQGQPVRLVLDALPSDTLIGKVERIALVANQSAAVVTYDVRVALAPTEAPVRVGMTASATVIVQELNDTLRVPNLYVRLERRTNQAFVNLVNADSTLTEIPISIGLRTEEYSEIVGGLNEGDAIGINLDADNFSLFGK
jgi:HlyD family secretion protein